MTGMRTFMIDVANVKPAATFHAPTSIDEGQTITLSLADPVDVAADLVGLQYAFDFGDGAGYGAFGAASSATSAATPDNGARPVKGMIKDKDGGITEYTASVTIKNVAPAVSAAADQSADEGTLATFNLGSFTDVAGDGPWTVEIAWGDGSSLPTFTQATRGALAPRKHKYDDNGSYTVSVKITDKNGDWQTKTFLANIDNVEPLATLGNNGPVNEGAAVLASFTGPSDPSDADTAQGFRYSFALDPAGLASNYLGADRRRQAVCRSRLGPELHDLRPRLRQGRRLHPVHDARHGQQRGADAGPRRPRRDERKAPPTRSASPRATPAAIASPPGRSTGATARRCKPSTSIRRCPRCSIRPRSATSSR